MATNETQTHFGYRRVSKASKARLVGEVFDSVAERYDLMNDLMSVGLHRWWKKMAVTMARPRRGERVLDLAGGTGDMTRLLAERVGERGRVTLVDINEAMLRHGRERLLDAGLIVDCVLADAEALCFPDGSFDLICCAFGLRNITDKAKALAQMHRALAPGGRLVILEFSKPRQALTHKIYDAYSFSLLPRLGRWVVGDEDSYRYLVESIRMHPDQQHLEAMLAEAGFTHCRHRNILDGIVAIHMGARS